MKLIDLLVQELPKRGGWPQGAEFAAQDDDGTTWSFKNKPEIDCGEWIDEIDNDPSYLTKIGEFPPLEERLSSIVTREKYEAALAASKQVEWSGDGLPPVGCECELVNFYGNDFPEFVGEHGEEVKIIGSGFTNGCPVAFYEADGGRGGMLAYAVAQCFRPIRTEAERKREDAEVAMRLCLKGTGCGMTEGAAKTVFDAIAAGKIPGVRLTDESGN